MNRTSVDPDDRAAADPDLPPPVGQAPAGVSPEVPPIVTARMRSAHGPWKWLIRSHTFVRKELVEIIRQPRLIALLVIGPFVLLLLFGAGYTQNSIRLRTMFVAPQGSVYEEMLDSSRDVLDEFIDSAGLVSDRAEAVSALDDGEVELVVVFPDDPLAEILAGERATIEVLDREIDPIQRTAIGIAARLAVQELNSIVLATVAGEAQQEVQPGAELAARLLASFPAEAESLAATVEQVAALDPDVLVRPFSVDTDTVIDIDIDPTDYFTPAALALLLQHLALTFAALSLVRDRGTGLFELLRIGPLSSTQILFGKCLAYLLVGGVVAAALASLATFWLGVPFVGDVGWFAAMVAGVLLASLALGMVLSSISKTESQAVQFAMLTLLAGMFFSGFVLGLDNLAYPVKLISWTLPVTYGIRSFHTVMLLGDRPATGDIVGLVALTVVYGSLAGFALRRSLRSS